MVRGVYSDDAPDPRYPYWDASTKEWCDVYGRAHPGYGSPAAIQPGESDVSVHGNHQGTPFYVPPVNNTAPTYKHPAYGPPKTAGYGTRAAPSGPYDNSASTSPMNSPRGQIYGGHHYGAPVPYGSTQSGDMYQPSKSGGLDKGGFRGSYPQPPHPKWDAHKPSDTETKAAMDLGAFGAHMASQTEPTRNPLEYPSDAWKARGKWNYNPTSLRSPDASAYASPAPHAPNASYRTIADLSKLDVSQMEAFQNRASYGGSGQPGSPTHNTNQSHVTSDATEKAEFEKLMRPDHTQDGHGHWRRR